MQRRDIRLLILIVVIAGVAAWIAWPDNPGIHIGRFTKEIKIWQGLDLQGGMQVLLEADVAEGQAVDSDAMEAAKTIVENRVNGLGVSEPVVQRVGNQRILVELPGIEDPDAAVAALRETGLMEWVDTGAIAYPPGTMLNTNLGPAPDAEENPDKPVYTTVLTGKHLKRVEVTFDKVGTPGIAFELDAEGAEIFAQHTANNVGKVLAIVLDKHVISSPHINTTIPDGRGEITGKFTVEEARTMVMQLRYGALPVPLRVMDTRAVGPTLGQDSVDRSMRAGIIGLSAVLLFMLIYYRLPGLLADLALIIYALVTLALFKTIPVTLTLPGIAGFLLSVGMAVDANILIFERMREELRQGRTLQRAITAGFRRAWTSILDSNISTWITCAILWFFGNSFGASVIKGFAITLTLGVLVSMFTAVLVTRTLLSAAFALFGEKLRQRSWLLGI